MRLVLDTNSLLVCIGRLSKFRPIFDALLEGRIQLLISNEILNEYVEKLQEKTNLIVAENIANFLLRSPDVERIDIYFNWSIISEDVDDNKFVDCALNGRADYLVTDDKHYNLLKSRGFPVVNIIRTQDFLKLIMG
ncbi:putative toxin-antitoxin system toxin component, PIN family [Persicitalea sp.]|uniref:putative toxin-antitoxin system toxin component, PIN family n=1 Tax=Persicitalea sp. TaxID=3100273 RepID=UPI0035942854